MEQLVDMHMHAGFAQDPPLLARELGEMGVPTFSNTITPLEYLRLSFAFSSIETTRLGVGIHPWWVGTSELGENGEALMLFEDALEDTRFVGEVGLDFWPKHEHTSAEQLSIFKYVAALCALKGDCVISMHAVKAERELLDTLEMTGCLSSCTCILHSYGGPSDQLTRAIAGGCLFSIGKRMLSTKRGREYARIIPEDRLLIESDMPDEPGDKTSAQSIKSTLDEILDSLSEIRSVEKSEIGESIASRSLELLA